MAKRSEASRVNYYGNGVMGLLWEIFIDWYIKKVSENAMKRPIYEDEASLKSERETALAIEKAWKCNLTKLPMKSKIDFLMKNKKGEPRAFVEVKNRACKRHKYPTYMISLDKWVSGLSMSRFTEVPLVLVVSWDDEIGYVTCGAVIKETTVNMGGREDRGDAQDIEPVVHIPIYLFETLVKHS